MKKIVMITNGLFPEGEAGALRIRYIAKALISNGCEVTVLCRGTGEKIGTEDGIKYYSLRNTNTKGLKKVLDYFTFPSKVKKYLYANEPTDTIYVYNAHVSIFSWLKKYSKKTNTNLVHDCVEWYSPEEFKYGKFDLSYIAKNRINTKLLDNDYKIIAISKYLYEYFSGKGISTLRIPMLCDCSMGSQTKHIDENKVRLFYAGNPGGKDLIGNIIQSLYLLSDEDKARVKFTLIGCTKDHLINVCGVNPEDISRAGQMLELYGRMPREEVLKQMSTANFVVLSRDASLRYAKAGFPSKVVEALSNSTPMLCNLSSDLADYLVDGENAVIAKDHTPGAFAEAIHRAVQLSSDEKLTMCEQAALSAVEFFDYKTYCNALYSFILQ